MTLTLVPGTQFVRDDTPPAWVLEPFLVPGSTLMLYGRQGAGKSTLAYQLGYALATGAPWLQFPVWRPGAVVYLQLDMPRYEWSMLMQRAMPLYAPPAQYLFNQRDTHELSRLNILASRERAEITDTLAAVRPLAVILDTVSEGYVPGRYTDVNEEAREVIRLWRDCNPEGLFIFLKHERKGVPWKKMTEEAEEDDDAFSGAAGWETKVTTSLRLTNKFGKPRLWVQKCRLANPGFRQLDLTRDANGFFTVPLRHEHLLATWPRLLPLAERFTPTCVADVLRDISQRASEPYDTVKKAYQRATAHGTRYPWAAALGDIGI